ncbi:protein NRT1/ PTR FAMILY 2.9 [Cryptomeria japonica]|uniref:protein NRT1/ PTR FAMILY 2.9 n=1 Tax=Cryptomeria japonica TaxID=3369 RepID=UPI0027D9EDB9|nr:protein NRT1/ PTR FAMILY 2.9 [Cryptomeria japonica]
MPTAMALHGHKHLQLEMGSQAELKSRDNNHEKSKENGAAVLEGLTHQPDATKMAVSVHKKEEEEEGIKQPGGWKTMPYIIGNEACEKLATIGLSSNIVVYLTSKFNMPNVEASFIINVWTGTTNIAPLLGAFLSDSYIGRYWTIALGCIASLIGMFLLSLTAIFPSLRPPPCDTGKAPCVGASLDQNVLLYSSFAMMAIGAGGIRPCSIAFGADQFDYTSEKGKRSIQSFFNWYYFSYTIAVMISVTIIVYIQNSISWSWGLGIPSALMFFSVTCFFLGKKIYILVSPEGSSFTSFAQVIVCAIKKRHLRLPSEQAVAEDFYDPPMKGSLKSRMALTHQFMFLNKAALKTEQDLKSDGSGVDPWRLCSLQQVEELKSVIRIAPIWLSGINVNVCVAQLNTFSVLQALTMDRHLGKNFEVPAGSFQIFTMLALTLFLPLYDRVIMPFTRRMSKGGNGISLLQRIGVGYFLCILFMALAAVFETKRRNVALSHGLMEKPKAVIPMSALFLVPQYSVAGLAEAFSSIGLIEFLYSQFPENMRSVAGALFFLNIGIGNYVSSFLVSIIHNNTGGRHGESWLGQNLNKGRLDYFYWLLVGLGAVNLLYFLACARWYIYKTVVPTQTETIESSKKLSPV